ncbi:TPA: hypothetical protein ACNFPO_004437 [Citrobacter freundii]|nr:hypothetical protein [Escherichia coli]HCG2937270.1 hypothetical protein [Escherichia coli]HCG3100378.1 hypothetical protein [Escherichia coli]
MVSLSENITNAGVIAALMRAETLILFLSSKGIRVKSVSLRHGLPVIRIARHAWCEELKKEGRARFDLTGNDRLGRFRQGIYHDESGCRVVWSESIH